MVQDPTAAGTGSALTPGTPLAVEKPDFTESDLFNTVLIRGINEGFADVWGWLYTGQASFIYNSLAAIDVDKLVSRSLDTTPSPIFHNYDFTGNIRNRMKPVPRSRAKGARVG